MTIRIDDVILDSDATKAAMSGTSGNLRLGGEGVDGDVLLFPSEGDINENATATFHLDANGGNLWMGGNGKDGDLVIHASDANDIYSTAQATLHFDGNGGNLWMGGNGTDGDLVMFPSDATDNHDTSQATIHLDANAGDITLRNADCAEEFSVAEHTKVQPGSVMVLDDDGLLHLSANAYDSRVVGIISGAGDYRPGLVLDKRVGESNRSPIAVMGKAYCRVTAETAPIRIGDLLTTSDRQGHAMKADDPRQAFGAVIGKALASLDSGTGLVPVLVALQ